MNDKDFVSLEVAKLLKDKGFGEPCVAYYIGDKLAYICASTRGADVKIIENMSVIYKDCATLAPTLMQAHRWLWNRYRVIVSAFLDQPFTDIQFLWCIQDTKRGFDNYDNVVSDTKYKSYGDAFNAGLKEALVTIK